MSNVALHRVRFDLGAGCWIDIETSTGIGKSLPSPIEEPPLLSAEEATPLEVGASDGPPAMCWRDVGELFEKFQLREDTSYFVDIATPYTLDKATQKAEADPAWPFHARLAKTFTREPTRRWRQEDGKTVVTGQLRIRSQAGVLDLSTEFSNGPLAEVVCRKLKYFDEFKELLDCLAEKAAELLLAYDSPVALSFQTAADLAENEAAVHFLMRHVMSKPKLPTALEEILARPHVKLLERIEMASIEEVAEADPELVADGIDYSDVTAGGPLARLFGGYTPKSLPQRDCFESRDTLENRYAKAFLEHCSLLANRLEVSLVARGRRASAREAKAWAAYLGEALQHDMWQEVGQLTQIPANSQTLLKKRGYKDLLRYDLSLRMALDLAWKHGAQLADGLIGDVRPVNQIYEYWCFFVLREILLGICAEVPGGNFLVTSPDGLRIQLAKGRKSECRFEFTGADGQKAKVSLFYNKRFVRPKAPRVEWDGSYTSSFDPDFSVQIVRAGGDAPVHWLHFDAKYRLQRQQTEALFEDSMAEDEEDDGATNYHAELSRVHKQEDLFKMHTYRDGILGSRGAYVLFPGDGVGGRSSPPAPNFFIRHPAAFGGSSQYRIPSVGVFDLAPGGDPIQQTAIADLFRTALAAATGIAAYQEESALF